MIIRTCVSITEMSFFGNKDNLWLVKDDSCKLQDLINPVLASGDFCRLPITFANIFDPDQDRNDQDRNDQDRNVGPDLDPNFLTLLQPS